MDLRKIDALIAYHIFGWRTRNGHWFDKDPFVDYAITAKEVSHYTTDIAAAMLVMDTMIEVRLSKDSRHNSRYHWSCWWAGTKTYASTAALAICLTKLKREGVDYEQD